MYNTAALHTFILKSPEMMDVMGFSLMFVLASDLNTGR